MVQCNACEAWWLFSCAGVTGSITDRSRMCSRCKRISRVPSKVSVTSQSSSQLAESMARLPKRQELKKQCTMVELEKNTGTGNSAEQPTSEVKGNRQPAATLVQQHDSHPRQGMPRRWPIIWASSCTVPLFVIGQSLHSKPLKTLAVFNHCRR